jgi:hypothetical protein
VARLKDEVFVATVRALDRATDPEARAVVNTLYGPRTMSLIPPAEAAAAAAEHAAAVARDTRCAELVVSADRAKEQLEDWTLLTQTLGKNGLRQVAELCWNKSHYAAGLIAKIPGFSVAPGEFFKEFVVRTPKPAAAIVDALEEVRELVIELELLDEYALVENTLDLCHFGQGDIRAPIAGRANDPALNAQIRKGRTQQGFGRRCLHQCQLTATRSKDDGR